MCFGKKLKLLYFIAKKVNLFCHSLRDNLLSKKY